MTRAKQRRFKLSRFWDIGLRRWNEKRAGKTAPDKRPGVTINRRDLIAVPVPDANLLWHNLHVRNVQKVNGSQETKNIRVDIIVEGVGTDQTWSCGLEFDYANEESLYCRPLRLSEDKNPERMKVPDLATDVRVAFLPPMSGLAANETRLDQGAINVRLGEGRTAEVLRNLCFQISSRDGESKGWDELCSRMRHLFGVTLERPIYLAERGEISMTYKDQQGVRLDLSASGRGMQQTLLLLAYIEANPGTVLLLDEPDSHLEILRQRQIYEILCTAARERSCQAVIASHSEVVLNEAADRDVVVAFVGRPHRIDDRGSQLLKSLKEIGFEQFYQAELTGFVLYLEGSTDLNILQGFAETLGHPARTVLERPFVHYIQNLPQKAREHFHGLREAKRDLIGFTLCDRIEKGLQSTPDLREYSWKRREIENYLCQPETLLAFAQSQEEIGPPGPLFSHQESLKRQNVMEAAIKDNVPPAALRDPDHAWWSTMKASDQFLDVVFPEYLKKLDLPPWLMKKTDYHRLARFVPRELVSPEVVEVLDAIFQQSIRAKPMAREI